jgi:P27 family predicted phage terminase small subunit
MEKDKRGRKSIQQHKLDGTYRHDRHSNTMEGEPLAEMPDVPDRLKGRGRKEYKKLGAILVNKGVLTDLDLNLFEMYCVQFDIIDQAYKDIKDKGVMLEGSRGMIKSPAFGVLKESIELQNRISAKFGFTPVDRAGIKLQTKIELDPLEEVLKIAK